MIYGYTAGVFDLYHLDHASLLYNAYSRCDHLTVGLSTDNLAASIKGSSPVMTYTERSLVLTSVRWVDAIVPQTSVDKYEAWKRLKYNVLFVGDDWYNTPTWNLYENQLEEEGIPVIYIPSPQRISSSTIKERIR